MIELTVGHIIISIILLWASGASIGAVIAINLYIKSVEKQIIKKADKLTKKLKNQ